MKQCITASVFDIFKIGPGPSSSHTIGPMRAGNDFMRVINALPMSIRSSGARLAVEFFGSLALTGKGHGSNRAAVAGLLGEEPETCDTEFLHGLLSDPKGYYEAVSELGGGHPLVIRAEDIVFNRSQHPYRYANTMAFRLLDSDGKVLHEELYYSIGGGFLLRDHADTNDGADIEVPYRYRDWDSFLKLVVKYDMTPAQIALANELAVTKKTEEEIFVRATKVLDAMDQAVIRGLSRTGRLPGPLGLERRAAHVNRVASNSKSPEASGIARLDAFALAAAEENAAGERVVTAPTSGASGLFAGVVHYFRAVRQVNEKSLQDALLVAGVIGSIAKANASISGAEVGCQGEIGVAAAMAAAFIATINGLTPELVGVAAEIAMEHHLGLSCDPIDGYVQIPCIERNAVGAVTAFNAAALAEASTPGKQKVTLDEAFEAMLETGRSMNPKFKETALGGLAVCALCG